MNKWLLLALGGIAGTLGRYALAGMVYTRAGTEFPYGTLAVNTLGCLLIGLLGSLADKRFVLGPQARLLLMVGGLGAFTTFSTLMYETWRLVQDGQYLLALANVVGSAVLGFGALWLGTIVASLL